METHTTPKQPTAESGRAIDWAQAMESLAHRAWEAAPILAVLETEQKNKCLLRLAEMLEEQVTVLLAANDKDLRRARDNGLQGAMLDRLTLNPERILQMAEGVRQVAALPDPVGRELESRIRPNGLRIRKVRVPIGVIGIIYESRPNVTIDCAALCLKSGNVCLLRGGSESIETNSALHGLVRQALVQTGLPGASVQFVPTPQREALLHLLKLSRYIHCLIPRGGEGLIRFVAEHSTIPVIKHYKGVCTLYLDRAADPAMAQSIALNAKCQRPGVCNAIENLLVHTDAAEKLLPPIAHALHQQGVKLRCDEVARRILAEAGLWTDPASPEDWETEYLDLILSVATVPDTASAVVWINRHGSGHSDAIVTEDETAARLFQHGVDSATVYWNASTRFTDGFAFGLGAEIGISTDRLHARGPMGLEELCTYKYLIQGQGQIRE